MPSEVLQELEARDNRASVPSQFAFLNVTLSRGRMALQSTHLGPSRIASGRTTHHLWSLAPSASSLYLWAKNWKRVWYYMHMLSLRCLLDCLGEKRGRLKERQRTALAAVDAPKLDKKEGLDIGLWEKAQRQVFVLVVFSTVNDVLWCFQLWRTQRIIVSVYFSGRQRHTVWAESVESLRRDHEIGPRRQSGRLDCVVSSAQEWAKREKEHRCEKRERGEKHGACQSTGI